MAPRAIPTGRKDMTTCRSVVLFVEAGFVVIAADRTITDEYRR